MMIGGHMIGGVLEIPIRGFIGERNAAGSGVLPGDIQEALAGHRDAREIAMRIDSSGGYTYLAQKIYNWVRAHGARVTARVTGAASSAATVILLAADYREAAPGTRFVLHGASRDVEDFDRDRWTAGRHEEMAVKLKALNGDLAGFYARHLAMSKIQIEARLRNDWCLSADEALELGLVHHVLR